VVVGVAVAYAVHELLPSVSTLMIALVLGALVTNLGLGRPAFAPGFRFSVKRLLRLGIVLLGLQLAVREVMALGGSVLLVVVGTVAVTFVGTNWLGRRLGLSRERSLLVATGFSICGASAVAAMDGVAESDEEDVMTAIALVTIFGSLAIVALPLLQVPLGLDAELFGLWSGASVHEVGQVVATAGAAGSAALAPAVVVKLTRVALLAPLVAGVSLWMRRSAATSGGQGVRPPLAPLFVLGFLATMGLRSTGVLPEPVLDVAATVQTLLLTAAMFGMGASVRLRALLRAGGPSLLLGLASTVMIAAVALLGLLAVS
jgi:uncharacterized integral membrane protein (TIGR00698 family)